MTYIGGFTGTQQGMTARQKSDLKRRLALTYSMGAEFHHGDCIGADSEAAAIAYKLGYVIVAHPGTDKQGNSPTRGWARAHKVMPARPYLKRNRDIVAAADELYAAPETKEEILRSGTWATVRYGRKKGILVMVLEP